MAAPHVSALREQGYAIVRGFLSGDDLARARAAVDAVYAEGLKHHASRRDGKLCFEELHGRPERFHTEDDGTGEQSRPEA